jgi:NTP pyrophosphatase (non-canonical NTP hydrolase)
MSESQKQTEQLKSEILALIDQGIEESAEVLVDSVERFMGYSHQTAIVKGWWKEREQIEKLPGGVQQVQLALLMLIITELSEAAESIRHGCPPDDKVPEFSGLEAELGDAVIRILDMADKYNLRLGEAIVAKMRCNLGRPALHGGKLA